MACGLLALTAPLAAGELPHHQLTVTLDPAAQTLEVVDALTLPDAGGPFELLLNAALAVRESSSPLTPIELGDIEPFFGNNGTSEELQADLKLARYRLDAAAPGEVVTLRYGGRFFFELGSQEEEYTRGFRTTVGQVGEAGVYLSGSSFWYPHLGPGLVEFDLDAAAPEGWQVISQGAGTSRGDDGRARWSSQGPMDEIYLVGGPLQVWRDSAGAVEALVYLHERDDALAGKYLEATAQYLEMYRQLIGPYPYGKFALVENFWETGYGMPSFTLLGPQIVRFPFILHSSYPHEILHNWWGNSVFVDYASGNWCEGLTAYLADHLIQEQRGKGDEYRRATLQKYRDYVKEGRDFPLSEFRSRHSAATEAVGYGKTLMLFHMLRQHLGDEEFVRGLQRIYRQYRGQKASFEDLRGVFEGLEEESFRRFFDDWVYRSGAPELRVMVDVVRPADDGAGFLVEGTIEQVQAAAPETPAFLVEVPVVVQTAGGTVTETLPLDDRLNDFVIRVPEEPVALHVDPWFDVFRVLDPRETPPSIGQIFGEPAIVAVLPAAAGEAETARYRALVESWQSASHQIEIRLDSDLQPLPADRGVWLLGKDNRFAAELFSAGPQGQAVVEGFALAGDEVTLGDDSMPLAGHSLVVVRRHPENLDKALGWLVVEPAAATEGLGRKLPHYGKYSYLGFEGDEPTNVIKGQWPATDSPLRVDLRPPGENTAPLPSLPASGRKALAELPPVFSQQELRAHVSYLASPERAGRGVGTAGLEDAARYVEERFRAAGLKPGGDGGGFRQEFTVDGPDGPVRVANLIGVLPGTREAWKGQSALVTAHYDHLGHGWPDVREAFRGQIHPGADDNASGVAVLLELAKVFASGEPPPRTLVFVAFTAEEEGRLGSRYYVEHPLFPLDQVLGVVNLDTVGRLGDGKLQVLGTGTASEWPHIVRGVGFVTGLEARAIDGSAEASDQWSFIEKGVPGVQLFTGAHEDYHRPSDTAERVDGAGLVKVATFAKETVAYLAEREEPFDVRIGAAATAPTPAPSAGRKVLFGTVPEFAYPGPGVKVAGTTPDSPAALAGLQEGDILVAFDDREIADLRAFSEILKTLSPGQKVTVTFRRGDETMQAEVELAAR